jgi:hypothetical protein
MAREGLVNVRLGSFASVWPDHGDFRSTPVNGHSQDRRACLKGANKRHHALRAVSSGSRSDLPGATDSRRDSGNNGTVTVTAPLHALEKAARVRRGCTSWLRPSWPKRRARVGDAQKRHSDPSFLAPHTSATSLHPAVSDQRFEIGRCAAALKRQQVERRWFATRQDR